MKNGKEYKNAQEYWEDMYRRQIEEISGNEREKRLLMELKQGNSIIGSIMSLQREYGISVEEGEAIYEDIRHRCNEWEKKNMLFYSE